MAACRRQARRDDGAAARQHVGGERQRLDGARHLEGVVDAAAGGRPDRRGAIGIGGIVGVGSAELAGKPQLRVGEIDGDDALGAGHARAQHAAESPTPPRPMTATTSPGRTCAVLTAAPTPVCTAQPNMAASVSGTLGSIFTSEERATTAYSAKQEMPE